MIAKHSNNWGSLSNEDNAKYDELYEKYVPAMGNCNTLGGEILRAISRIVYRYYNDGDTVMHYYGSDYNCLKGADIFLLKYVKGYVSLDNIYEMQYEEEMCGRLKFIMDYLAANPNVFEMPNNDDFLNYEVYEPYDYDDDDDYYDDEDY